MWSEGGFGGVLPRKLQLQITSKVNFKGGSFEPFEPPSYVPGYKTFLITAWKMLLYARYISAYQTVCFLLPTYLKYFWKMNGNRVSMHWFIFLTPLEFEGSWIFKHFFYLPSYQYIAEQSPQGPSDAHLSKVRAGKTGSSINASVLCPRLCVSVVNYQIFHFLHNNELCADHLDF